MPLDTKHCVICGEEAAKLICNRMDCYLALNQLIAMSRVSPVPHYAIELVERQLAGIRKDIPPKMLLDNAISTERE